MCDSATPWTVAHQAPLSMGFPRQEYWSGLPLPSPEDLPDPGTEPASPILAGRFLTDEPPDKPSRREKGPLKYTHLKFLVLFLLFFFTDFCFGFKPFVCLFLIGLTELHIQRRQCSLMV